MGECHACQTSGRPGNMFGCCGTWFCAQCFSECDHCGKKQCPICDKDYPCCPVCELCMAHETINNPTKECIYCDHRLCRRCRTVYYSEKDDPYKERCCAYSLYINSLQKCNKCNSVVPEGLHGYRCYTCKRYGLCEKCIVLCKKCNDAICIACFSPDTDPLCDYCQSRKKGAHQMK